MDDRSQKMNRDVQRGRRIKEAAQAAGITLRDLAVRLCIARPTIYAYVAGTLRVPPARLRAIAEITKRPVEYFDQLGDEPGRWDGEMAVQHADAMIARPDFRSAAEFAADSIRLVPESAHFARGRLLQRAGTSRLYLGEYVEAIRNLEDAHREFGEAGRKDCQGDCSQSLGYCYLNIGLIEHARNAFAFALQHCDGEDRWRAEVSFAAVADRIGEFDAAEERLARLEQEPGLPEMARLYTLANLAGLASNRGCWDLSVERSLPVLEQAMSLGLRDQALERLLQIGLARFRQGHLEEASLWLIRAADAAALVGDRSRGTLVKLITASLAMALGETELARTETVQMLSEATRNQYRRSEAYAQVQLARLALGRADAHGALDAAVQAQTFCETYRYYVLEVEARVCKAQALTLAGRAAEAMELLDELGSDRRTRALGEARTAATLASAQALRALGRHEDYTTMQEKAIRFGEACGARLLLQPAGTGTAHRAYFLKGGAIQSMETQV